MDSIFKQQISKFDKKDGILALCMCLLSVLLVTTSFALRLAGFPWPLFVTHVVNYAPVVIMIVIVLCNKQGLSSIGFHREKIWPAIRLGLLFSIIPIVFGGIIPGLYYGFNQLTIGALMSAFAITMLFAAWEDILYAGIITPRLYGLVRSGWFAISVGAFLFAAMHVPVWTMNDQLYFGSFNYAWLSSMQILRWGISFIFYFAIFRKYYSIVPVILVHTINNFMNVLVVSSWAPFGMENFWIIGHGARLIAAAALFWHIHKTEKTKKF